MLPIPRVISNGSSLVRTSAVANSIESLIPKGTPGLVSSDVSRYKRQSLRFVAVGSSTQSSSRLNIPQESASLIPLNNIIHGEAM